jgi:hypothetical protein
LATAGLTTIRLEFNYGATSASIATGSEFQDESAIDFARRCLVNDRELRAEIVQSGTWLYADEVPTDVWIVKQNFEYHHEDDYDDGPEALNSNGEAFQVVMARGRQMISLGPAALSLSEAISDAEAAIPTKINWTNHIQQKLFGGRWYSVTPVE